MLKQIQERRSHFLKEFNGDKAPNDLIHSLIKSANWAPSHKLTLPFRFIVFSPQKLSILAQYIEESYLDRQSEPNIDKLNKIKSLPTKLSHAIAIVLKPSNKVPLWEEYASLGAAVQNMYLVLSESPNFGGYWTTGNEIDAPKMREALNLASEEVHCGYLFIGGLNQKRTLAQRPDTDVRWI